jgi:hypothetical protein
MRRYLTLLLAALVVVGTVAAVPVAGLQAGTDTPEADGGTDAEDGNATVAPGERLSGVVGVQQAEIDGEVEARSFGLSVARAASDEGRAALVAAEVNETGTDIEQLHERREQLREARQNGSISEGQYRARIAELAARAQNTERMANASENALRGLPADLLEANGVNATAIRTLRERASELGGQEVAEIARSIAGGVGPMADQRPDRAGGPDRTERTDRSAGDAHGDGTDRGGANRPDGGDQRTTAVDGNETVTADTDREGRPGGRP